MPVDDHQPEWLSTDLMDLFQGLLAALAPLVLFMVLPEAFLAHEVFRSDLLFAGLLVLTLATLMVL